jgi:CTP:molybdopterin cytidylyltransferase MocA
VTDRRSPCVVGIVLAAGAGVRYGGPKALVAGWLEGAVEALRQGGCDAVFVVLGAAAGEARTLVPEGVEVVVAVDWAEGMGSSLRAGLAAVAATPAEAAVIHLVDLPDVGPNVVRRMLSVATQDALARAVYRGSPGHPVLLGRAHWASAAAEAVGDQGARGYLRNHDIEQIECADLAEGHDVDARGAE